MAQILKWLFAKPNTKWKSATKFVMVVWAITTTSPAFHLSDVMHDWMIIGAWFVVSTVVLCSFINLANISGRVDELESELNRLRADRHSVG